MLVRKRQEDAHIAFVEGKKIIIKRARLSGFYVVVLSLLGDEAIMKTLGSKEKCLLLYSAGIAWQISRLWKVLTFTVCCVLNGLNEG